MTPVPVRWRKSSRSGEETNCIELAHLGVGAMRDSKNPTGSILTVDLAELLNAVKSGRVNC
jgi:hypothetical protein